MKLDLKRVCSTAVATYGVLCHLDTPFALTLERPWKNNQVGESCIPGGIYTCLRVVSPKFGPTWQVTDVPHRSQILFHKGNLAEDTHGCILVGEQFEELHGNSGIVASAQGFAQFQTLLKNTNEFQLEILELYKNVTLAFP